MMNSKLFLGFALGHANGQTDGRTNICELLSILKSRICLEVTRADQIVEVSYMVTVAFVRISFYNESGINSF